MDPARIPPRTALAFQEDAKAIASWARSHGFDRDAEAMEEFAAKLSPYTSSLAARWTNGRAA